MTKAQTIFYHGVLRALRRQRDIPEELYREALFHIAGVESSKDLDNTDFEQMLAWFERCGWRDEKRQPDHWRTLVEQAKRYANKRVIFKIEQLVSQTTYRLDGLCRRFSEQRTQYVGKLYPHEAWAMIEMLKAVIARDGKSAKGQPTLQETA